MNTQYTPKEQQTLQSVDPAYFSGKADFYRLPIMPSNGDILPTIVHFEPNSVTNWHSHSQGQYLIVTDGIGRFQQWGKPVEIITKGDVVWVAPNVKHWHGADEFTAMTHIAISPVKDNKVIWLDKVQLDKRHHIVHIDTITDSQFTSKQLAILSLAVAVTQGDQIAVINAIEQGLNAKLTISELTEIISHQFSYIGAPKTLNGIITLKSVIEQRAKLGIVDPKGRPATDLGNVDYYHLGEQKLVALTNRSAASAVFDFAPAVDYAIKAQLFGYQFSRDNLGDVERELATVASLLGLGESVNDQLRSHLIILKNLGLTDIGVNQLARSVALPQAKNLQAVWVDVSK
ncbi:cupin domain-containing carboxymuconolactone decarboxylase family protein [Orbus sturtevantii]|uniref:cupin domain-containing carboxymuconolactone decarboxylase family protein n=1 Tax=Orbus sturtevantii TaxID=3074109 RepID=UPI00370DB06D